KITVNEGKFHEVRRIFRALGNEVTELERLAIGKLELPPDLKPGQWRPLTDEEKELLVRL
ncbi:MAG: rRNA pseudouridine synthase, partial [Treponema sp.]|nr:rRNA pseudouridine synthase [Treponema sp.]